MLFNSSHRACPVPRRQCSRTAPPARAGYSLPTGRENTAFVAMDTRLYALGGSRPTSPSPSETAVEAYFIPGWTTVTPMPTYSANMGQSVGVHTSDSMIVVAGTYSPGAGTGLQTMKYTASTDTWVYGTLRSLPRESVFCEPSERSHFRP